MLLQPAFETQVKITDMQGFTTSTGAKAEALYVTSSGRYKTRFALDGGGANMCYAFFPTNYYLLPAASKRALVVTIKL